MRFVGEFGQLFPIKRLISSQFVYIMRMGFLFIPISLRCYIRYENVVSSLISCACLNLSGFGSTLSYFVVLCRTGWCESRGTVLSLSSVKTEMTDTIEIGLKILPQHLCNQKYIVL